MARMTRKACLRAFHAPKRDSAPMEPPDIRTKLGNVIMDAHQILAPVPPSLPAGLSLPSSLLGSRRATFSTRRQVKEIRVLRAFLAGASAAHCERLQIPPGVPS
eukprot:TRINITY_DN9357_c0_g1_i1.p2 TRINITY_DN9357_c0_g1~~TRINITY_DN9357_c0_g1_i1.p2  ORF type:complete len:104 (+),score=3.31 TRINITY_DN9357_c0_g1_i1:641-952(+)